MSKSSETIPPCSAYIEGPQGITPCASFGPFVVERVADGSLTVCAEHLGSVLMHAKNVLWPPAITWEGRGLRPSNTFTKEQEPERIAAVRAGLGLES
jgi:hypothetical protein